MKLALVTGGAQGIGAAIGQRLAKEGINLSLVDINIESLERLSEAIRQDFSVEVRCFRVDVSNSSEVAKLAEDIEANFGRLDILVNNAGIVSDSLIFRMSDEAWQKVLSVNLNGAFNLIRYCAKLMMKRRYGRIINISSVIGLVGNIGQANYAASKAGLIGLTKSAAKELAKFGITVNAICPGFIDTPMTQNLKEHQRKQILERIPLARFGSTYEVAELVNFLASDNAGYITGQTIVIDGGLFM